MYNHVLYLSYDGMTDPLGQSQVIPYLQGLCQEGYKFTLISFEKPKEYKKRGKEIRELLSRDAIKWIPLKYHKSPPVFSVLYDIWQMYINARRVHLRQTVDIVHCRSYISAIIGLRIKRAYGIKFIFDMRGFWPDERVEGGIWNLKNPVFRAIYQFFKKNEITFFESADYTISLTEDGKEIIQSWKHIRNNPIPIQVIPCCADLELFDRESISPSRLSYLQQKFAIEEGDFVLLYLGSLGTWYMLNEMLDFFVVLLKYRPDAHFLFVTKEPYEHILCAALNKKVPTDRLIVTFAERMDLPNYIALAQLSIFFIKPVFSKKASSPTKQGELMGMGIPIICNDKVGDAAEIIQETGSGAVIEEFTRDSYECICKNINKILSIPSSKIRSGAEQIYSLEGGIAFYSKVYEKLLQ